MSFKCTQCGACCRMFNFADIEIIRDKNSPHYFPYDFDKNGVCEKLVDNKCSVYEDRPYICNVDKVQKNSGLSKKEYYKATKMACATIIDLLNMDPKLKP